MRCGVHSGKARSLSCSRVFIGFWARVNASADFRRADFFIETLLSQGFHGQVIYQGVRSMWVRVGERVSWCTSMLALSIGRLHRCMSLEPGMTWMFKTRMKFGLALLFLYNDYIRIFVWEVGVRRSPAVHGLSAFRVLRGVVHLQARCKVDMPMSVSAVGITCPFRKPARFFL